MRFEYQNDRKIHVTRTTFVRLFVSRSFVFRSFRRPYAFKHSSVWALLSPLLSSWNSPFVLHTASSTNDVSLVVSQPTPRALTRKTVPGSLLSFNASVHEKQLIAINASNTRTIANVFVERIPRAKVLNRWHVLTNSSKELRNSKIELSAATNRDSNLGSSEPRLSIEVTFYRTTSSR